MAQAEAVTPDQVSLGVLVSTVPRDAVDAAVAGFGVGAKRSDGTLPAHVVAYLTMALCLFAEDDYEEVATKVTGALTRFGCWDASWSVPTSSGVTQARQRLGAPVMEEIFRAHLAPLLGTPAETMTPGQLTYDLRRLRHHGLLQRVPGTHRYTVTDHGLHLALFLTRAHTRLLRPGLSDILDQHPPPTPIRRHLHRFTTAVDEYARQQKLAA